MKLKTGIIGCGKVGDFHAKAYAQLKNSKFTAVCDANLERAKAFAERYNIHAYSDIAEMIQKEHLNVVSVCTPHPIHCDPAVTAAENGCNVLIEKPLASSLADCDRIIEAGDKNHVTIGTMVQRRFYRPCMRIHEAIEAGKIGKPVLGMVTMLGWRDKAYYDSDAWRGTWALDGGGALMNQAVHGIDMLIMLGGDVKSVFAKCETKARNIEVEDTAAAIIKYKNGALGVMEAATSLKDGQETVLSVSGTDGMISFGDSEILTWNTKDGSAAPSVKDSMGGKNCAWTGVFEGHRLLVENMADAIENGTPLLIPACDARKAVDVILAIYRSSQTGKEVFLDR